MTDAESAEEAARRKEEARRLRRQRQNIRNLIASLAASLGIVVFLVFVVARPDQPIQGPIDYRSVAIDAADSAPADIIVPNLDDTWSSNRATISQEGFGRMWAIGLLSTTGDYVEVAQVFDPSADAVVQLVGPSGKESETTLGGATDISWTQIDRSGVSEPGNSAWALTATTTEGLLVVSGTTQSGVLFVASQIQADYPDIWP